MKKLALAMMLIPLVGFIQPPRRDEARDRMLERERMTREIDYERASWREELRNHQQNCRREQDRINREHENRIRQIERRFNVRR